LPGELLLPFLKMGLIRASLQASGIMLLVKERLKITLKTSEKAIAQLLTTKGLMRSIPGDFLGLSRSIYLRILSGEKMLTLISRCGGYLYTAVEACVEDGMKTLPNCTLRRLAIEDTFTVHQAFDRFFALLLAVDILKKQLGLTLTGPDNRCFELTN